jgi:hypothetical protein
MTTNFVHSYVISNFEIWVDWSGVNELNGAEPFLKSWQSIS